VNAYELRAALDRVAALPPCDCLVCTMCATPLDPRGLQPRVKKPRAKRGQSLKSYMDSQRCGVITKDAQ